MALQPFKFVGAIALVVLFGGVGLGVLSRYSASAEPAQPVPPAKGEEKAAPAPARQFSANQFYHVQQIVEGQTHARRLGTTMPGLVQIGPPGRRPGPVQIPAGTTWYVQHVGSGNFGFGGGFQGVPGGFNLGMIGAAGALGAGGGNLGAGGAAGNVGAAGAMGGGALGAGGAFGNLGGGGIGFIGGMPGPMSMAKLTGNDLKTLTADLMQQTVPGLRLENIELSDDDLARLVKDLPQLQTLLLFNTKTTDAGVAHLAGLKNLRNLGLEGTEFTDKALGYLQKVRPLDTLRIGGPRFTARAFASLAELNSLRTLRLNAMDFNAEGMKSLAKLVNLETLEILGEVGDAAMVPLAEVPNLKQVRLHFSKITGKGLAVLSQVHKLEQLTLDWMWGEQGPHGQGFVGVGGVGGVPMNAQIPVTPIFVTPEGKWKEKPAPALIADDLKVLAQAKNLTDLHLMGKDFGNAEAEALKDCVALKKLELFAPALTDAGVTALKEVKALERLNVCFSQVTPACTATLKTLPNLKTLFVPLVPADPAYKRAVAQYQQALPRVTVQTLSILPGVEMLGGFGGF